MRISGLRRDRWVGKGAEDGAEREIRTPEAVRPAVFETAAIPGLAISAWLPQSSTCIFSLGPLTSRVVGHRAIRRGTKLRVRSPSEVSVSGRSSIPFRAGPLSHLRSYGAERVVSRRICGDCTIAYYADVHEHSDFTIITIITIVYSNIRSDMGYR